MNERIKQLAEWDAAHRKEIADLTDTPIKKLAVSSGIYDCITDPYDKLKNGDQYSSVMPDLVRFAELIVKECVETLRLVPYDSDREFGDEDIYQEAIIKHFGITE